MQDSVDQLIGDVIVDAYGDDEQLLVFCQWFNDTGKFPFTSRVVGVEVQVIAIDYRGDDRRGLPAVCLRNGERHSVSLLDIAPADTTGPDTRRLIDAYCRWAHAQPLHSANT
ncbi:MAG: calcium-binding protein [Actinomycetota bacterium]|nr:calcium-binding protein [Actinomycetota bacterium]